MEWQSLFIGLPSWPICHLKKLFIFLEYSFFTLPFNFQVSLNFSLPRRPINNIVMLPLSPTSRTFMNLPFSSIELVMFFNTLPWHWLLMHLCLLDLTFVIYSIFLTVLVAILFHHHLHIWSLLILYNIYMFIKDFILT